MCDPPASITHVTLYPINVSLMDWPLKFSKPMILFPITFKSQPLVYYMNLFEAKKHTTRSSEMRVGGGV